MASLDRSTILRRGLTCRPYGFRASPYVLPVADTSSGIPIPAGMVEHETANGLQVDVVGGSYVGGDSYLDYWVGRPVAGGFQFSEDPSYLKSQDLGAIDGISTDGSMIFGRYDIYNENSLSLTYFPAAQTEIMSPCLGGGDSHGDILMCDSKNWYLAQP